MKFASLSFATAFASNVLPVPGGPYNKIPAGGLIPILLNASGFLIGHSTDSFNFCIISSSPPISSYFTLGTDGKLSLKERPDYETKTSYTITIKASETNGQSYSEDFTIAVTDVPEASKLTSGNEYSYVERSGMIKSDLNDLKNNIVNEDGWGSYFI